MFLATHHALRTSGACHPIAPTAVTGWLKTIVILYGDYSHLTHTEKLMPSAALPYLPKLPKQPKLSKSEPPAIRCPTSIQYFLLFGFLIHFLGVLAEPLRFFSRSEIRTGPEFAWLSDTMKPYSQWLYLNHGYFFFAPNPGPGHLIQCKLSASSADEPSGQESSQVLLLPDRNEHWPRLLYHRYFMLSEFYTNRYAPEQVTQELKKDLEFMQTWASDKELYDLIQSSIVSSLKHSRNVEKVKLRRIERLLPDSQQVLKEGWSLNDPRLTSLLSETMIEATAIEPIDELPNKASAGASR